MRTLAIVIGLMLTGCIVEDGDEGFGCDPHFDDQDFGCPMACDASGVVIIDGDEYCTNTCDDVFDCASGHTCVVFAGADPPSACLPTCSGGGDDCPSGFLGVCSPEGVCGL